MANTQNIGLHWRGLAWSDGETIPRTTLPNGTLAEAMASLGYCWDANLNVFTPVPGDATYGIKVQKSRIALTPSSPTAASVGVASAQALATNANRKGLVVTNTSANQISLGLGAAAILGSGITLNPNGGTWVMDDYTFCTSEINAIASVASSNLAIQELA